MKKIYFIITSIIAIILIIVAVITFSNLSREKSLISNFEQCAAAGHPILESFPRQCKVGDKIFTEKIIEPPVYKEKIKNISVNANDIIKSPLTITGEARGNWFFEASFPIKLLDGNGNEIATTIAQAQSDWMMEEFVQFKAILEFKNPETETGKIVLEKDNPSGLSELNEDISVPIRFQLFPGIIKSGISGTVLLGPTCPVVKVGEEDKCADKPYQTTIEIYKKGQSVLYKTINSLSDGTFKVILIPDIYILKSKGGDVFPVCESKEVSVLKDKVEKITLLCDSGIR